MTVSARVRGAILSTVAICALALGLHAAAPASGQVASGPVVMIDTGVSEDPNGTVLSARSVSLP